MRRRWTAVALGKHVSLTFAEKTKLAIKTIACVDRSKGEVKAYYLERRRERDRRRMKAKRAINRTERMSPMAKGWSRRSTEIGLVPRVSLGSRVTASARNVRACGAWSCEPSTSCAPWARWSAKPNRIRSAAR
jgi:hypothetical protein